jgi:hypothetical protein
MLLVKRGLEMANLGKVKNTDRLMSGRFLSNVDVPKKKQEDVRQEMYFHQFHISNLLPPGTLVVARS